MIDVRSTQSSGFTLVELLIVLTIIGLTASLVAPLGAKQFDKARAQEEWLTLRRTVDGLAFRAYSLGRETELHAKGTSLEWAFADGKKGHLDFKKVFFAPEQTISIDRNGYADRDRLELRMAGAPRELTLNNWLTK